MAAAALMHERANPMYKIEETRDRGIWEHESNFSDGEEGGRGQRREGGSSSRRRRRIRASMGGEYDVSDESDLFEEEAYEAEEEARRRRWREEERDDDSYNGEDEDDEDEDDDEWRRGDMTQEDKEDEENSLVSLAAPQVLREERLPEQMNTPANNSTGIFSLAASSSPSKRNKFAALVLQQQKPYYPTDLANAPVLDTMSKIERELYLNERDRKKAQTAKWAAKKWMGVIETSKGEATEIDGGGGEEDDEEEEEEMRKPNKNSWQGGIFYKQGGLVQRELSDDEDSIEEQEKREVRHHTHTHTHTHTYIHTYFLT